MFNHKLPADFPMQTLRKKTSPCKYKNEPGRFLGEGVSFRAKLIGVLEVPEARGDRMCQEALADLKMAIRAAGEHKQRIQVHVAIDGLRLRDDKTGDSLYHHPVHKISFIAQDMTDSRAFGYIFGSPDTGHRFFGIKTDKAASQVVIAMRDLFQVVFELKKKEIELAKQQLEGKGVGGLTRHAATTTSDVIKGKSVGAGAECPSGRSAADGSSEGGVAELVDLEQELSSLRRGLTQVEGLTPSGDPFGDSFIVPPQKGLLPPPPSGSTSRGRSTPASTAAPPSSSVSPRAVFSPSKPSAAAAPTGVAPATLPFDLAAAVATDFPEATPPSLVDNFEPPLASYQSSSAATSLSYDVFTELDPLGTGRSKPYVDKKLFFQELKNPPKKVLKDLVPTTSSVTLLADVLPVTAEAKAENTYSTTITSVPRQSGGSVSIVKPVTSIFSGGMFATDPFAETDPFDTADPFSDTFKEDPFVTSLQDAPKRSEDAHRKLSREISQGSNGSESGKNVFNGPLHVYLPPEPAPLSPRPQRQTYSDTSTIRQRPQPSSKVNSESASPPPPLPPKKAPEGSAVVKPPPRPPHEHDEDAPPLPRPVRRREPTKLQADRSTKPRLSSLATNSSEDEYLTPVPPPLPGGRRFDITLSQLLTYGMDELAAKLRVPVAGLSSMTLPQLTAYLRSYLADERASVLSFQSVPPEPTTLTRPEQVPAPEEPAKPKVEFEPQFEDDFAPTAVAEVSDGTFVANFDLFDEKMTAIYDRYAAFREMQQEVLKIMSTVDPPDAPNGEQDKDSEKADDASLDELAANAEHNSEVERISEKAVDRSPLRTLDELTLDSFNMFRKSVSPKPSQIDAKIEDIKTVMKNLQLEQSSEAREGDKIDRYAALREITITEPSQDEFESLPPEVPKERKRSDEKSDGFDNSDFFDCIDNSSLSFSHVDDAFRKSPSVIKEKETEVVEVKKVEEKTVELKTCDAGREAPTPMRLSTGSLSDVASASSPDTKDKSASRRSAEVAGRWSVLAARASPWSSDSKDSEPVAWRDSRTPPAVARQRRRPRHCRSRQTSSSSRDVSPWDEEPPPPTRHHRHAHPRDSRHNSSGSRECLDSGSGRDKEIKLRDKRDRERDRESRDSGSTRERDRRDSGSGRDRVRDHSKEDGREYATRDRRDRRSRDRDKDSWERDRDYSRDREYRDSGRSRERLAKEYKEKERDRHRMPHHSWDDEEDYSDGSSPRDRWPDHRCRRDERSYGSLGWRESRRRADMRPPDDAADRRYGATMSWGGRRAVSGGGGAGGGAAGRARDPERRRGRRDDTRHRHEKRDHQRFVERERDRDPGSPFDDDFIDAPPVPQQHAPPLPQPKKRGAYSSLEGTRFVFESEETTASPVTPPTRSRDVDSPATRFRFDSESLSPRSMFEDDFLPRARAPSIAEEDEGDLPPLRARNQPPASHKDIRKSESVNIFVRETDPFEGDDFFACTGSDRAARRDNWPGDFQPFDNV